MAKKKEKSVLEDMRAEVEKLIDRKYSTVEQFCFDKDLNKATVSNFLHGKKDFQISTLEKIADALDKRLVIKIS